MMSALKKRSRAGLMKTSALKSSCTNSVAIFCQVPTMMQTGGGDEKVTFQSSPNSFQSSLGFSHMFSSQQKDEALSELDFERKSQDELNHLSSEVRVISMVRGSEDEHPLTERHFSLKIGQHLKQLRKRISGENKVEDSFKYCLKRLLSICDPSVFQTLEDSYLDNFKLEIAMLKNWIESKEDETNLTIDATNLLGTNRWYDSVTAEYFENLPNLLKRAFAILTKIKTESDVNFEIPWLQFLQWEEYPN
ncbi:uncharacterized protein LOC117170362 [Belonocnema kinseyi]|uniref:uncharacterized protein LOC117170362 n=1 Tax=Belonocnema kinseyi TaxID=2817044 RepID=UPI00143DD833|nr:uncharacterized protein LOC117170362 [Belonocnema kinseyi]XP_033213001.1 uncharacterized protein LOC117170362 [Belonocnema kinseyi]